MSNPGIFITQLGEGVPTAADYQFVFNSNWPSLQCVYDKTVTLAPLGTAILNHNQGFPPLTIAWVIQTGVCFGRIFDPSENFEITDQTDVTLSWDNKSIYLSNAGSAYQVCVKCYNIDISKSIDYTLPKFPSVKQPYDSSIGIKVSKFNKGITSTDLRDFILHSRAQSPALLSTVAGNSSAGNGIISYNNPAGYVPWTFAFFTDGSSHWRGLAPGFQQTGALFKLGSGITQGPVTVNNGALLTSNVADTKLSLVMLRDPLAVAGRVEVQY